MRALVFAVLLLAITSTRHTVQAQETSGCPSTTPLSLVIGQQGRVISSGGANRIRNTPSTSGTVLYQIEGGGLFDVIGEAACGDGYRWWHVSVEGQEGWTVEGDESGYFLEVIADEEEPPATVTTAQSVDCDMEPRLMIGREGRLTTSTPSRVRETPSINGVQVGQIQPLTPFTILEGSVCADGIHWWRVSAGDLEGWTAEGVEGEYLIDLVELVPTPTPDYIGLSNPHEISWNSDDTRIAVGTDEGVFIYDTSDWLQPPTQLFAEASVLSLAFVPENPHLLAVSLRDTNAACDEESSSGVFVYDLDADDISLMIRDFSNSCGFDHVSQLQFNAEGTLLITNSSGQFVAYAFPSGEFSLHIAPYNFGGFPEFIEIAMSGDGSQLALAQPLTDLRSYLFRANYAEGELIGFEDGRVTEVITALALTEDGNRIVIGDAVGSLRTYTRTETTEFYSDYQSVIREGHSPTSNRINAIDLDPNGMIVTAESDPYAVVRVFEPQTLAQVATYLGDSTTTTALDLDFNADGSLLAVLIDDTVHILDTADYSLLVELVLQRNP